MLAEQRMKERLTEQEDGTDEVPLMDNNERPQGVSREAQRTKGTHTVVSECHVFLPLFWLISRNADR